MKRKLTVVIEVSDDHSEAPTTKIDVSMEFDPKLQPDEECISMGIAHKLYDLLKGLPDGE